MGYIAEWCAETWWVEMSTRTAKTASANYVCMTEGIEYKYHNLYNIQPLDHTLLHYNVTQAE